MAYYLYKFIKMFVLSVHDSELLLENRRLLPHTAKAVIMSGKKNLLRRRPAKDLTIIPPAPMAAGTYKPRRQ